MSKKKYIQILGIIFFLAAAFFISFNWGMKKFSDAQKIENQKKSQTSNNIDKFTSSNVSPDNIITSNSKIIVKVEYTKSGDVETNTVETSNFIGKSKSDLENQGYIVESITSNTVNLYKKVDSYAPNKYILGIRGECLAIYKTDENGNMYIENESTDVTDVKVPTKGDYNILVKGSKYFQFNNKEEAEEKLGEYSS